MTDDLRAVVQPFYAAFGSGDAAALDRCFAKEWRDNTLPPGRAQGLEGIQQAILFLRAVVPDIVALPEDVRVDGDVAMVRLTFRGTNTGGWPGVGPNGAKVEFIAFDMHRVDQGRIVESWHLEDNLTLMTQLGVVPPLG